MEQDLLVIELNTPFSVCTIARRDNSGLPEGHFDTEVTPANAHEFLKNFAVIEGGAKYRTILLTILKQDEYFLELPRLIEKEPNIFLSNLSYNELMGLANVLKPLIYEHHWVGLMPAYKTVYHYLSARAIFKDLKPESF